MKEENFIARVLEERKYQERVWGRLHDAEHHPMEWSSIMMEYLGRYARCANDWPMNEAEEEMESYLVKVAAIAMAAYEFL